MPPGDPATGGHTGSASSLAGIRKAEQLLQRVHANISDDLAVGVLGPGGCGKSALLAELRREYLAAGVDVVGIKSVVDDAVPASAVVLVDDAHTLTPLALQRLRDLVGRQGSRLVVAFRPWPRPPALTSLAADLRRRGPLTVLQQLGRADVEQRSCTWLSRPLSPELLDLLTAQTGGQPQILDEVLSTIGEADPDREMSEAALFAQVVDRLGFLVDDLDPTSRKLLHAIAAGADLETGVLSTLLGVATPVVRETVEQARAGGYLLGDGRLIPLFRAALLGAEPVEETRRIQVALLDIHTGLGQDVVPVARSLARSGIWNERAATVLIAAADARLRSDPAVATSLYADAVRAGAAADPLAVRRAEAAVAAGRLDDALRLADPVLAGGDAQAQSRAIDVIAAVMAHRGQLGRAAELYQWLGPQRIGAAAPMAALALIATGSPAQAQELLQSPVLREPPTMLTGAKALIVEGMQASLGESYTSALSALSRATSLLESAGCASLLVDSPAALTGLVAIGAGEFGLAESLLRRAADQQSGGQLLRPRHLLLLAMTTMLRGHCGAARDLLAGATPADSELEQRDEFLASAVAVGLARRSGDPVELARQWDRARATIVRQPIDLLVLLPLGEFAIAAAQLGESHLLETHLKEAWYLLSRLGDPWMWSAPLLWAGVQAAIARGEVDDVESLAAAMAELGAHNKFAGALAAAARTWSEVLNGGALDNGALDRDVLDSAAPNIAVDTTSVQSAASGLQCVGFGFEAAQLLGAAAGRCGDRKTAANLLQGARGWPGGPPTDVTPTDGTPPRRSTPTERDTAAPARSTNAGTAAGQILSSRELQVATLLLRNQTYREIGERLFISPKTVEHHVARMKQRIGASRRSELFAELRVLTKETG